MEQSKEQEIRDALDNDEPYSFGPEVVGELLRELDHWREVATLHGEMIKSMNKVNRLKDINVPLLNCTKSRVSKLRHAIRE